MDIFQFFKNNSSDKKVLSHQAEMLIGMLDRGVIGMIDLEKGSSVATGMGRNSQEKFTLCVSEKNWALRVTGSVKNISNGTVFRKIEEVIPEEVLAFEWTNECLLEVVRALKGNNTYATVERGFGWRAQIREDFSGYHTILIYRR